MQHVMKNGLPPPLLVSPSLHDASVRSVASTSGSLPTQLIKTLSPEGDPPINRECRLIAGWLAMSAQIVLFLVVITALTVKRLREKPRRPWLIWLLDVLKQACSGAAGHTVGMLVAILAHQASHGASECGWYFVVYFADCTLGITLAITIHKITNRLARHYSQKREVMGGGDGGRRWWDALVEIGNYGDPPSYRKWGIQVVFWVLSVVTARTIVGIVVITNLPLFNYLTNALDMKFSGRPGHYLFTVMVGIPVVINIGQAWIQDQVLKFKHRKSVAKAPREDKELVSRPEQEASAATMMVVQATGQSSNSSPSPLGQRKAK